MARSLNEVKLIGNLTRDPELRYTPQGTAVVSFGVATNRGWVTDDGEKREETEFHRIVAWNKLAELCSQLLSKGRKVYVSGRLANRSWTGQDGVQKSLTEIVIDNMIILDSRKDYENKEESGSAPIVNAAEVKEEKNEDKQSLGSTDPKKVKVKEEAPANTSTDVNPDDIPF